MPAQPPAIDPEAVDMPTPPNLASMRSRFKEAVGNIENPKEPKPTVVDAPQETTIVTDEEPKEPKNDTTPPAPAKPEPKEPESKTETEEELPEAIRNKPEATRKAFKELKDGWKQAQAKVKELEERLLKQTKPNPELTDKLNQLEQERNELTKKLKVYEVSTGAELQRFVKTKFEAIGQKLKRLVPDRANELLNILRKEPGQAQKEAIREVMGELDEFDAEELKQIYAEARNVHAEKEKAIQEAETNSELILQQRENEVKEAKVTTMRELDAILGAMSDPEKGIVVFQKREGDEAWNSMIERQMADARMLASGDASQQDILTAFALAAAAPTYHRLVAQQGETIQKLRAQIEQLQGTPTMTRQPVDAKPATGKSAIKPDGTGSKFSEIVMGELNQMLKHGPQ